MPPWHPCALRHARTSRMRPPPYSPCAPAHHAPRTGAARGRLCTRRHALARALPGAALLALLLTATPGGAGAQVARPHPVPLGVTASTFSEQGVIAPGGVTETTLTPDNPAALMQARSALGAGALRLQRSEERPPSAEEEDGTYGGGFGGFRAVGSRVGVAFDGVRSAPEGAPREVRSNYGSGQLAVALGRDMTLGAAYAREHMETPTFLPGGDAQLRYTSNTFGVTLQPTGWLTLGYAFTIDTLEVSHPAITSSHFRRNSEYSGAALRFGESWRFELEAGVVNRPEFPDELNGDMPLGGERQARRGRASLRAGGLLLSAGLSEHDTADADVRLATRTYDLGWAPAAGFFLTLRTSERVLSDERTDPASELTERTASLALGASF